MSKGYAQTARKRLFCESPLCRKCGVETFLATTISVENINNNPQVCTIQHNKPRNHPEYKNDITLWCYKCNNDDNIHKQSNKIYSREEFIQELYGSKKSLHGLFLIDGFIYNYVANKGRKLISKKPYIDFRFEKLEKYMSHFVDTRTRQLIHNKCKFKIISFEGYIKSFIKGVYNIEQYKVGDGWYEKPINK